MTSAIRVPNMSGMKSNAKSGLGALGGLVYFTEVGRTCPACRQPIAQCACKQKDGACR